MPPPPLSRAPLLRLRVGAAEVEVEVALGDEAQRRGLAGRDRLEPGKGMLFPLPSPRRISIRMAETPIPLDALLLDADGRILEIVPLEPGRRQEVVPRSESVSFLLETPAGWARSAGIEPGEWVRLEDGGVLAKGDELRPSSHPGRNDVRELAERMLEEALADRSNPVARLSVLGGCMSPLLEEGDLVEIEPLSGPPGVGAILLARGGAGELVCHRFLGPRGEGWFVAGDRSAIELLPPSAILGVARAAERSGRRISLPGPFAPILARLRRNSQRGNGAGRLSLFAFRLLRRFGGWSAWWGGRRS
jgi:uncharacterized membrane protein (UPF0127 family)